MEPVVALVVAAGSGSRLGGPVPKALRQLAGRPLVRHAVERLASGGVTHAIVVIPQRMQHDFELALAGVPIPVRLTEGGAERQESVAKGLTDLAELDIASPLVVLVHDAARALVPPEVVARVIAAVRGGATAVVPVVPVNDSIRRVLAAGSEVVDRADLRSVQTPQGFALTALIQGHQWVAEHAAAVTDDAMAAEAAGHQVTLVEGSTLAMKITTPLDLSLAAVLIAEEQ